MVMLSHLRYFALVDACQRHAQVADLAVALLEGDYPPVTHLFFYTHDKQLLALPWEAVRTVDWRAGQIITADLAAGQKTSPESLRHTVLLGHDVLDALILDLQNRRATRANDLWLEEGAGKLLLRAADPGVRAILRRLSRGRYGRVQTSGLADWKYIEFLRADPHAVRAGAGYHRRIARLPSGEVAHLTNLLPYLHAAELLTLLPDPVAADTLEALSLTRQLQIFEELDEDQGLRLLELMPPDAATDLVSCLSTRTARRYLNLLSPRQSERVIELLRYPADTVGGIMTNDTVSVLARLTVKEAQRALQNRLRGPDFVY